MTPTLPHPLPPSVEIERGPCPEPFTPERRQALVIELDLATGYITLAQLGQPPQRASLTTGRLESRVGRPGRYRWVPMPWCLTDASRLELLGHSPEDIELDAQVSEALAVLSEMRRVPRALTAPRVPRLTLGHSVSIEEGAQVGGAGDTLPNVVHRCRPVGQPEESDMDYQLPLKAKAATR